MKRIVGEKCPRQKCVFGVVLGLTVLMLLGNSELLSASRNLQKVNMTVDFKQAMKTDVWAPAKSEQGASIGCWGGGCVDLDDDGVIFDLNFINVLQFELDNSQTNYVTDFFHVRDLASAWVPAEKIGVVGLMARLSAVGNNSFSHHNYRLSAVRTCASDGGVATQIILRRPPQYDLSTWFLGLSWSSSLLDLDEV